MGRSTRRRSPSRSESDRRLAPDGTVASRLSVPTKHDAASRTPSAQVFIRLHVEPHRKQRELAPGDQEPTTGSGAPTREPRHRHQDAEPVEEDERMEVADDVLLAHAPEEPAHEQP